MSSKGTLILTDTGNIIITGDLCPKQDEDGPIRTVNGKCFQKISSHPTGNHWAAIDKWGNAWTCGDNNDGQCAHPINIRVTNPIKVSNLKSPLIDISAGHDYTLSCDIDGNVCGWGSSANGRLGNAEIAHFTDPVYIQVSDFIVQVAAGSQKAVSLALSISGIVYCWGDGNDEKLGETRKSPNLFQLTPIKINLSTPIGKIVSGAGFCAALTTDGQIITWGKKEAGRLGHGKNSEPGLPSEIKVDDEKFIDIACGAFHCLAIDNTGTVWTWGDNKYGQLGSDQKINNLPKTPFLTRSGPPYLTPYMIV